ncbi:hypothetical protein GFGA_1d0625 [Gluconobacter frateurii NBRC 103465]|nr:hypothetical protein GFGA_1d0625 [Gluconobacter frateurii NBRC 103465]
MFPGSAGTTVSSNTKVFIEECDVAEFLKNIRKIAFVLAVAASAGTAMAQAGAVKPAESVVGGMHIIDRTLVLPVGGTEIVALPPDLQTATLSLPDVLHVNLVSQKVAEILAHHEGQTDVLFTGKDAIYRFHVTVVKHPVR